MEQNKDYLKELTILFVDDEDGVRQSYSILLNMWAKKAYTAKNGKEGLEIFEKYKPDIIVTDIKMPVMNGLDMIRYIKQIDPEIPTIITTAHQEPELLLDAVELQVDGYIVKPIPKKELKKRLENIAKVILFEKERDKGYDVLKHIIDNSLEAILLYKENICVDVNNAALEMFGFSNKSEIIGKDNLEQVGKSLQCVINKEMECESKEPYETLLFNKENEAVSALVRCKNMILDNETIKIIAAVDLTHIKILEDDARKKEQILFQQSKMASMGEMIGNIAHQWRQPIAIISMWANNIIADIDMSEVNEENLKKYANSINKQTKHLSQTIDDFRNFFIPNKDKTTFTLKCIIDKTVSLLTASFKTHNIEVIENIEDIQITALENELTQAILNILKNAKDILITLPNESKRLIFINIYKNNNKAILEIKDNGGGVSKEIIAKVFEPYFTTKHKSQGTGIGLYMTQSIITEHLDGKISVENIKYMHNDKEHSGAKFIIEIPIKNKK